MAECVQNLNGVAYEIALNKNIAVVEQILLLTAILYYQS